MRILIVDDEDTARYGMRKALQGASDKFVEAPSLAAARKLLAEQPPDLILLDLNLGGEDGFELLEDTQRLKPPPAVIVITAHGNERIAVDAMKRGAYHYLAKPFDIEELRLTCRNVRRQLELRDENLNLRAELERFSGFGEMIGDSEPMRRVFSLIERVAETDVTVLMNGESGSGKELVAREIHRRSRRKGALVCVNCAAIPENLIESELFGHEKGAFTGALDRRAGKFEQAQGGTLFLDEIGDMPLDTQTKILRVLEERRIQRVGGTEALEVDVRIISATHQDLPQMVRDGKFREDLYYRLSVIVLSLPPLRVRDDDVVLIAQALINNAAKQHDMPAPKLNAEASSKLRSHSWPGNIRELKNVVERALLLSPPGELFLEIDAPESKPVVQTNGVLPFPAPLIEITRAAARATLEACDGNRSESARQLGISRRRLRGLLEDLTDDDAVPVAMAEGA